ncbi:hypothetical protein DFP73DRAFT_78815 [Morchella snyderi]|nr:hypothetical protein DFP73DRAFT_78815 [Morchella snyderi]
MSNAHTFRTNIIRAPISVSCRSSGNGHVDLNHNAPPQSHHQNGQRFDSGIAMSRSQREQTVESQHSKYTDSTIDQERVEVAGSSRSSTPSSSAHEATQAAVSDDEDKFWICCGGDTTAVCPYDGTYLVDLHVECSECRHRRCKGCKIMIVTIPAQPGDVAP